MKVLFLLLWNSASRPHCPEQTSVNLMWGFAEWGQGPRVCAGLHNPSLSLRKELSSSSSPLLSVKSPLRRERLLSCYNALCVTLGFPNTVSYMGWSSERARGAWAHPPWFSTPTRDVRAAQLLRLRSYHIVAATRHWYGLWGLGSSKSWTSLAFSGQLEGHLPHPPGEPQAAVS